MEYSISTQEVQEFYKTKYTVIDGGSGFSFKKDELDLEVMKMSISEWEASGLKAHLIESRAREDVKLLGGIQGDFIVLHFVCEGETYIGKNKNYPPIINKNTNNFFNATNQTVNHCFKKDQTNTYFKVFFPSDYINTKANIHPEIYGILSTMSKKQCPVIQDKNLTTTLEMKMIIEQIMNTNEMGSIAPFYFETKIQELLALQLQQMNRSNCPGWKHQNHYSDQLNEARNLIENNFGSALTIAKIAKHIGMSETVLKTSFKRLFGTTIFGYLFNYKMNIAKQLLLNSTATITEIGYQTGYEYPSHFTTAFKRKFGISPIEFRTKRR
jgi:AraC-like DNA-binding protein